MRKILLLNLTRMGDILETAPLLRAIRRAEPTSQVTMLINETFRPVAELLADIDRLVSFPIFAYARDLREGDEDLIDLYRRLEVFVDELAAERFDLVLNVTNSQLSGVLMGFVNARQMRGLWYDSQGARQVVGTLIRYFGANDARRYNPFNLSDFMLGLYGFPETPGLGQLKIPDAAESEAQGWLEMLGDRPLIGIQLGASEASKRWRIEDFAAVSQTLLDNTQAGIVLLGSLDERPLADELQRRVGISRERLIDLVGRTSMASLAAVTRRLAVLVTNDTGTMHLAAALGVRVLNLSLGSAFFRETGPYGEGHLILEPRIGCRPCNFRHDCSHFDCKRLVTPSLVAGLAGALLRGEDGLVEALAAGEACDVYRTGFDEEGLLYYARLTPRPLQADEVMLQVYRVAIGQSELGGDFELRLAAGLRRLSGDGRTLQPGAEAELHASREHLRVLEAAAGEGLRWTEQALDAVHSGAVAEVKPLLEALSALDQQFAVWGREQDDCRLLTRALLLDKEALRAERLEVLLRGHRSSYLELRDCAKWSQMALGRALAILVPARGHAENAGVARTDDAGGFGSWT